MSDTLSQAVRNARVTFLTRCDTGIGIGEYDSIRWAFEVHVHAQDEGVYHSAVLYGNEDDPERIDFYRAPMPTIVDSPDYVWPEVQS